MLGDDEGLGHVLAAHDQSDAQFRKVDKHVKLLKTVNGHLEDLTKLADAVAPEDVMDVAGKIVGAGAPAMNIASLLATMPTDGGQALQSWVGQMHQRAQASLQQAQAQAEAARHQMGTSALRAIVGHTVAQHRQAFAQQYEAAQPTPGTAPTAPTANAPSVPTMQ